jgi:hypothetical protein
LEDTNCVGLTLASLVILLLLYDDDIVLMTNNSYDLGKKLITLKEFFYNMGMIVNTGKTKVMIVKSKRITYNNFVYDNNNLDEVPSYEYIGINFHHMLNWNYNAEKTLNGGWKYHYGLENSCKSRDLWLWDKKKSSFTLSSL